jgi:hypothetical protein
MATHPKFELRSNFDLLKNGEVERALRHGADDLADLVDDLADLVLAHD